MKKIILIAVFIGFVIHAHSQQWGGAANQTGEIYRTGSVGIGNTNPYRKLEVGYRYTDYSAFMRLAGHWDEDWRNHSKLEFNDHNFGIGAGSFTDGGSDNDDLYLYSYKGTNRDIRFMATYNGNSSPSGSNWKTNMIIKQEGNVGIGTLNPKAPLHIEGDKGIFLSRPSWMNNNTEVQIGISTYNGLPGLRFVIKPEENEQPYFDVLHLANNGKVGIGTTNPSHKLTVNGEILCETVRVEAGIPYADYVFEDNYELTPLPELEKFINENKHLPEIPSESDVCEDGINLSEFNILLLKKVEELTLYTIELNKKIEQLEKESQKLNN